MNLAVALDAIQTATAILKKDNDMSQQQHQEFEERSFELACKVAPDLTDDELHLLCYHMGLSYKDVLNAIEADLEPNEKRHFMEEAADFAESLKER